MSFFEALTTETIEPQPMSLGFTMDILGYTMDILWLQKTNMQCMSMKSRLFYFSVFGFTCCFFWWFHTVSTCCIHVFFLPSSPGISDLSEVWTFSVIVLQGCFACIPWTAMSFATMSLDGKGREIAESSWIQVTWQGSLRDRSILRVDGEPHGLPSLGFEWAAVDTKVLAILRSTWLDGRTAGGQWCVLSAKLAEGEKTWTCSKFHWLSQAHSAQSRCRLLQDAFLDWCSCAAPLGLCLAATLVMDSQSTRGVFGRWSKKGGYQQIQQWDIKGIVMGYNLAEQEDLGMPKNRGYPPNLSQKSWRKRWKPIRFWGYIIFRPDDLSSLLPGVEIGQLFVLQIAIASDPRVPSCVWHAGWVVFKAGPSQLSCQFAFRSLWPCCITTSFLTARKLGVDPVLDQKIEIGELKLRNVKNCNIIMSLFGLAGYTGYTQLILVGLVIPKAIRNLSGDFMSFLCWDPFPADPRVLLYSGGHSILDRTCGGLWPLCHLVWLRRQSAHALWSRRAPTSSEAGEPLRGANKVSRLLQGNSMNMMSIEKTKQEYDIWIYLGYVWKWYISTSWESRENLWLTSEIRNKPLIASTF